MKLELLKQGLRFVVGIGVSVIVAGVVDKSRENLEDGKVVSTLVKLGSVALAAFVADKVGEHMEKRVDETVLAIKDSKELYEDYKEERTEA